jgi:hypothetical protein
MFEMNSDPSSIPTGSPAPDRISSNHPPATIPKYYSTPTAQVFDSAPTKVSSQETDELLDYDVQSDAFHPPPRAELEVVVYVAL